MLREVELAEPSGSGRAAAAAGAANADDDDDDDARLLPATLEPEAGGAGQGTTVSARFWRHVRNLREALHAEPLLLQTLAGVAVGLAVGAIARLFDPSPRAVELLGFPGELFMRMLERSCYPSYRSRWCAASWRSSRGHPARAPKRRGGATRRRVRGDHLRGVCHRTGRRARRAARRGRLRGRREVRKCGGGDGKRRRRSRAGRYGGRARLDAGDGARGGSRERVPRRRGRERAGRDRREPVFRNRARRESEPRSPNEPNSRHYRVGSANERNDRVVADAFLGANAVVETAVGWAVAATPIGVCSIVAARVAGACDPKRTLAALSKYVFTVLLGLAIHGLVALPVMFRAATESDASEVLSGGAPALAAAFATDSSSACLPRTIQCALRLGVPEPLARFALPPRRDCEHERHGAVRGAHRAVHRLRRTAWT